MAGEMKLLGMLSDVAGIWEENRPRSPQVVTGREAFGKPGE